MRCYVPLCTQGAGPEDFLSCWLCAWRDILKSEVRVQVRRSTQRGPEIAAGRFLCCSVTPRLAGALLSLSKHAWSAVPVAEAPVSGSKASSSVAGHALPWVPGVAATTLSESLQPWLWSSLLASPACWASSSVAAAGEYRVPESTDHRDTDLGECVGRDRLQQVDFCCLQKALLISLN